MIKQVFVLSTALLLTPAWAINKCTGPDGKTVFQDAPCMGKGEEIQVKPASGSAARAAAPAAAAPQAAPAPQAAAGGKKEGAFGETWQRRTWLEQRGLPDARGAIDNHQRKCANEQAAIASKKQLARNNLAGATYEQSISTEMQAAATMCDSKARELRAQLESYEREYRDLQARP
ncbi:DUF4124 domain-containing protein [Diaphorobacter caeni]|uniref:DUF4124 domain-containing protein n=1 Tax=Diaphorobacter caeni TaxID=2784387 RepID=UPI00188EE15B|nr:DUF4124 domain-containing protein [Diaphorobacter caeni]MBF5006385.1 DUF4124 domain-containing protein [Diaphorobacter caeni]